MLTVACGGVARGAVISETLFSATFLQPTGSPGGVAPPYVELNDLPTDHAIDLAIVNADSSPIRHGLVLQVFTLPVGPATRLLSQGAFPAAVLEGANPNVVQTLPAGVTLNFSPTLPRSLLLFDGVTGLSVNQRLTDQADKLVGKPLLDALTFGANASTHGGEPVWNFTAATAAARPRLDVNDPGQSWVWGVPNSAGVIGQPPYRLSPGLQNHVPAVPEPATAVLLGIASMAVLRRR